MAVELASAYVSIVPSAQGMAKNLTRELGGPLDSAAGSAGKRAGGVFSGALGTAVKAAGGLFIAHEAFGFAKDALGEARESIRVSAQTEQAIKSTGGAAKVTTKEIGDLANAISRKTGIDDEQIQSAANMLLTFTNIKNEAGKGNDIFNQSTAILADMSKVFGTDASGAAIQLGKALNDPIAGISALSRVGVKFTPQMKEQIKSLVEHGKVAEAQKIILKELNTEFGGQAAAQATAADRLKVTIGNIKEQIGGVLVPIVDRVAGFLADQLPGWIDTIGRGFGDIKEAIGPTLRTIGLGLRALVQAFKDPDVTSNGFVGQMERLGVFLRTKFLPAAKQVVEFLKNNWKTVLKVAGAAFLVFTGPVTFVVASLALLYVRFKVVRDVIGAFVGFVRNQLIPTVQAVATGITQRFAQVVEWFRTIWPQISEAVSHVMNVIRGVIRTAVDVVSALWRAWGDDLLRIVKTYWNFIQETVENALQVVKGIIKFVLAVINGDWGKAWDALKSVLGGVWDQIGNIISTAVGVVQSLIGGMASTVAEVWSGLWSGMTGVVDRIWVTIQNVVRSGVNVIIDAINVLIKAYNLLPGHKDLAEVKRLLEVKHNNFSFGDYAPDQFFAEGGWVQGPLGSPQLAVVHGGERVLSTSEIRAMSRLAPAAVAPSVVVHVSGVVGNERSVALKITELLSNFFKNGGAKPSWAA